MGKHKTKRPQRTLRATTAQFSSQDLAAEAAGLSWNRWAIEALTLYASVAAGTNPALKPQRTPTL